MKKLSTFLTILLISVSLCGCGSSDILGLIKQLAELSEQEKTDNDDGEGELDGSCESHYDEQLDGICDYCKEPFTRKPLETPVIYVAENGELTWYKKEIDKNCYDYLVSVNGVEQTISSSSLEHPAHGDVIRVKALAINEHGMYLDSEWSEEFVFYREKDYDFLNLGLTGEMEEGLLLLTEKGTGVYPLGDSKYILCENGDMIIDEGSKITVFVRTGYEVYTVYEDHYTLTRYGSNYKNEYYQMLYLNSTLVVVLPGGNDSLPSGGLAYVAGHGRTLLEAGEPAQDREGYCELATYTEYSSRVNPDYLFITYMHPQTRTFDYLSEFADKVKYWRVLYIDDICLETGVEIQFTSEFTNEDSQKISSILKGYGMSGGGIDDLAGALGSLSQEDLEKLEGMEDLPEGFLDQLKEMLGNPDSPMGGMGGFEGELAVYTMPFEHEGDNWYDRYKMTGVANGELTMPFTLQVEYLYKYWYDGGSFATYVCRKEGLYRHVSLDDSGFYVIDAEGNRLH